jgi:hypothetical protein
MWLLWNFCFIQAICETHYVTQILTNTFLGAIELYLQQHDADNSILFAPVIAETDYWSLVLVHDELKKEPGKHLTILFNHVKRP